MAVSSLILLSLLNTNAMSNMFDLNYLKTQEKRKHLELKKQEYDKKRYTLIECKRLMMNNNNKINNLYKANNSKHCNYSNFNIKK